MSIPITLAELIEKALAAMEAHPEGRLNRGYRQAIWAQFGPRLDPEIPESKLAHRKRTFLALQAVKHGLGLWRDIYPGDPTPEQIADQVAKILAGTLQFEAETGLAMYDEYWSYFDNKTSEDPAAAGSPQISIGYGAALCFYVALIDENFEPDQLELELEDAEDPYEMDVAQLVANAWASGGPGGPDFERLKRMEFWRWWLTEAVGQAWNQ